MSQAENLLDSLTVDDVTPYTAEPQTEGYIVIGRDRFITVPESLKRIAVQDDHNIETVTFECPRYWDENDLSEMQIFINYRRPDGVTGSYIAKNVKPQGDLIYFDWTIESHVTEFKGQLDFLVCTKETDDEGMEKRHWNTELNRDMYISEGLEVEGEIVSQNPAIITDLLTRMDEVEMVAVVESVLEEHVNNAVAAVGRAEAAVLTATSKAEGMSALFDKFERVLPVNRFNGNVFSGYIRADGTGVLSDQIMSYTGPIPVNKNEIITLQGTEQYTDGSPDNRVIYSIAHVAAYDADMEILPFFGTDTAGTSYVVPAGVSYIRISSDIFYLSNPDNFESAPTYIYDDIAIVASETVVPYEGYFEPSYDELKPESFISTTSQLGNAVKGNASGDIVTINDVSPVMHNITCWVHGKNLFNGYLISGILRSSSFAVDMADSEVYRTIKFHAPKAGVYTVSFSTPVYIARLVKDGSYEVTSGYTNVRNYTFSTKGEDDIGMTFRDATSSETPWSDTNTVHIEAGSTPTEYEPYINPTAITVSRFGKNLLDISNRASSTETINGVTVTRIGNQIKLSGTLTSDSNLFNMSFNMFGGSGKKYTLSYIHDGGAVTNGQPSLCVGAKDTADSTSSRQSWLNVVLKNANDSVTNVLSRPYIKDFWIYVKAGTKFEDYRIRIQLEVGDTATEYEAADRYIYTPDGNGLVDIASVSPTVTLLTDAPGSVIECEYNRDMNKVLEGIDVPGGEPEVPSTDVYNLVANALKGAKTGEVIAITDASPLEHEMGVKARGKNLLNLSNTNVTSGGEMTIDGTTITLTRKATGNPPSIVFELGAYKDFVGKTLTISFVLDAMGSSGGTNGTATMYIHCGNTTKEAVESVTNVPYTSDQVGTTITKTFTVPVLDDKGRQLCIRHYMSNGKTEGDYITISNVQVEESTTATAYASYIEDISTVKVKKYGKNLFKATTEQKVLKGITAEKQADGTYHVYGTSDGTGDFWMDMQVVVPKGTYTGSGCPTGGSSTTYFIEYHNKTTAKGKVDYGTGATFETAETNTIIVHMVVKSGQTVDLIFKPMIEVGAGDKAYEPYIEPIEYPVSADGTVNGIVPNQPTTTLMTDTAGAVIDCTYNRDLTKAFTELENKINTLLAATASV